MESELEKEQVSLQRAIDIALWMNFKYREAKRSYAVLQDKKTKRYQVVLSMSERKKSCVEFPKNYLLMDYKHLEEIRSEYSPLSHWEEIIGLFSSAHGEILRFLLYYQVPLEKIIRLELASRGHDENHHWVGFEKARAIWLENDKKGT